MLTSQLEKASRFRSLHRGSSPLVLPNAWDASSARIFEDAGFEAIGTTSAGIAFSYGYPDGERIPREQMLEACARICAAVAIPVTADLEAGYGSSPEDLERTASAAIQAGAIGMNLEDATGGSEKPLAEIELQTEKIRAVREASRRAGISLVLNARTDVYLLQVGPERERFAETVRRGTVYRDAGADCIFVPGLADRKIISDLVKELAFPINILAVAGSPSIAELKDLGVARVSLGSGPIRATLTLLQRMAAEIRAKGTYSVLEDIVSHARVNELMA